jgi:hypothetical protein
VKKGRGNGVVRALGETRDEFDAFWIDGPTGTHSDDDEAHAGGKITILLTARARGDSQVSRKARAISVIGSDVCWASSVKGLDVNQEVGACPVIITKDDVGGMANPSIHWSTARWPPRPPRSAVTREAPTIASRKGIRAWTVGS